LRKIIIDCEKIRANINAVKRQAASAMIIAELGGDGQGLGLVKLAELLRGEGISNFAVSEISDAEKLRSSGFTDEHILMLRSTADAGEIAALASCGTVCTIGSYDAAIAAASAAEKLNVPIECMLKIDCGEGHFGFLPSETDKILNVFRNMKGLAVNGVYTKLSGAPAPKKLLQAQLDAFEACLAKLVAGGAETGISFALDSYSLFKCENRLDAVCVGSAFAGRTAGLGANAGLERVGFIEADIDELDWLPAGATVGLGKGVKLRRSTKAAAVSVGWYNGVGSPDAPGGLFRKKPQPDISAAGKRVKIIGAVGPYSLLADVTEAECGVGDKLTIDVNPKLVKGLPIEYR
jgi:alanine racemase